MSLLNTILSYIWYTSVARRVCMSLFCLRCWDWHLNETFFFGWCYFFLNLRVLWKYLLKLVLNLLACCAVELDCNVVQYQLGQIQSWLLYWFVHADLVVFYLNRDGMLVGKAILLVCFSLFRLVRHQIRLSVESLVWADRVKSLLLTSYGMDLFHFFHLLIVNYLIQYVFLPTTLMTLSWLNSVFFLFLLKELSALSNLSITSIMQLVFFQFLKLNLVIFIDWIFFVKH